MLTYGPDRDWVKNPHRRRRWPTAPTRPQPLCSQPSRGHQGRRAAAHVTGFGRRVFLRLPFEDALLLSWGQ